MLKYSSIVSIVYFVINFLFLTILAIIVYKQGQHKLKSKSYLKDVWCQRKIYAPLIIHFYDTATDIGVIYNWYELMTKEQTDPLIDYESVNMTIFFWTGISFLIVYRLCTLIYAAFNWLTDDGMWYDVLLVLTDLYIFKAVYESFSDAQGIITANAAKRQRNAEKRRQKREEMRKKMQKEIEMTTEKPTESKSDEAKEEENEVEPADLQIIMQFGESITESMPQIVLQSVFIIRSANDPDLAAAGSNIYLVLFSVIASLFSISGRFSVLDKEDVTEEAKSLKPRERFPDCIQYWYIVRVVWRMSHIMSRFGVFVLVWTVMGGAWLPIWAGLSWMFWTLLLIVTDDEVEMALSKVLGAMVLALIFIVGIAVNKKFMKENIFKIIETLTGFVLITIFVTLSFDCGICADPETRQLFNNANRRILIFWSLTLGSLICESILFAFMYFGDILD